MTVSKTRRELLTGGLADRSYAPDATAEIVSLIVNVFPAHLESVSKAISNMPGAEVHGQDPKGKLIVVLEAPTQGIIGAMADAISSLSHVISAAMVFQATDEAGV